eukprot:jgi/Psemu1/257032/estExt_Genewise1Plus.C_2080024
MAAKTNQDRGGVAYPYGNCNRTALFAVYDGHGQGGELVSQYSLHQVQHLLERHPGFYNSNHDNDDNIETAFKETFVKVDESLKDECLIEPLYAGTTACVVLLRDTQLVVSNAGDSRAVLGRRRRRPIDLTIDQNPDLPAERERIERMGGYVTPAPEPGEVWLDKECSQIGLAMARSIGDHAVKPIGVIAEPVVTFHDVCPHNDEFLILATDGVWEFMSSEEAVKLVSEQLELAAQQQQQQKQKQQHKQQKCCDNDNDNSNTNNTNSNNSNNNSNNNNNNNHHHHEGGATRACRALIEAAAERWHAEEGDYRDDITAMVIRLKHLLEPKK